MVNVLSFWLSVCVASDAIVLSSAGNATRPHILSVIVDDLGRYDTQITNPNAPGSVIGALASEGIILDRFYAYMYCSPTRRSFLAGRFATKINPDQAQPCSNFMPLQFTLFPEKLKSYANYTNHFIGKGHLGYPSTDHLPINRGYATHVGYLGGAESYDQRPQSMGGLDSHDFWHDHLPANDSLLAQVWYSTNYYTTRAETLIEAHDPSTPLYIDLRYQGVHGPYVNPPIWEQVLNTSSNSMKCGSTYSCQIMESMVSVVDAGIANVTNVLKKKNMWNSTLMILFADNGGGMGHTEPSNNYPLRGTKGEPWEGAVRVAAFVSGGWLPQRVRGTVNSAFISVADWYPTLLSVAGLAPEQIQDTINYANASRPIDGINAWPALMGLAPDLGREWLPTTNQSLIWNSTWKLITTAPSTHWFTKTDGHEVDGWPCRAKSARNVSTKGSWVCEVCSDAEPCLFNLIEDPEERKDLAKANPDIVATMRKAMEVWNFNPYTGEDLLPSELEKYDCLESGPARQQFWGGMAGPCCHPKGAGPWPPWVPPKPTPPPGPHPSKPGLHSNIDKVRTAFEHGPHGLFLSVGGWAWNGSWASGGVAPVIIRISVDGLEQTKTVANIVRPKLPSGGAPNTQHGFAYDISGTAAASLAGAGSHSIQYYVGSTPDAMHDANCVWTQLPGSPWMWKDGKPVPSK